VKGWRDYQWQLQQCLVAIDDGYESELRQLTSSPNAALDMSSANAETRNRSNKLYSLLASLMKSRCLAIVKLVFEALRQLILALRPPVQKPWTCFAVINHLVACLACLWYEPPNTSSGVSSGRSV
jgi:hypothetical protein